MASPNELEPPQETKVADPGAHQLAESSDSEDQFADAQSYPNSTSLASPVPKTRVERVDDEPAYGEVPGTQAYQLREGDAAPDEIAVIPEQNDADAAPEPSSTTPGTVPVTVVEEAPGGEPSKHSDEFESKREADAAPDVVLKPEGEDKGETGEEGAGTTGTGVARS
jgi:hypothetical protein